MSDDQKRTLERQLWDIANVLRGKMNADEYKNYILGFIFYKYLSEQIEAYVDEKLLISDDFNFIEITENTQEGKAVLEHVEKFCIDQLGFFIPPSQLFKSIVAKGQGMARIKTLLFWKTLRTYLIILNRLQWAAKRKMISKGCLTMLI